MKVSVLAVFILLGAFPAAGVEARGTRYALILKEAPLARQISSRKDLGTLAVADRRSAIQRAQAKVRQTLAERGLKVTWATDTLLNAIFVDGSHVDPRQLQNLAGVARVFRMPPIKRALDTAVGLVNAPAAWGVLGGVASAGLGIKIGVIDTGIDQNHAAFQDASLPMPTGFPKGTPQDIAYTNNKVIVARSYVEELANYYGTAQDSRPDDLTPRDRVGHGTAVAMIAAGVTNTGPLGTITGVAPKAYLGNYKVFGSPGVNDYTFADVVLQALTDAFTDGMDIVTLSLSIPATWSLNDIGSDCGNAANQPCDPWVAAVENAMRDGLTVVAAAGNDGNSGYFYPALNSIDTPGSAPSAITVGATTNAHAFFSTVRVGGADAPSGLSPALALFGDGPKDAVTAPVLDVSKLNNDGLACSPLADGSLNGAIALIQRGTCGFDTKVNNAQKAGAAGALIYQSDNSDSLFAMTGLSVTGIPAAMIGATAGNALKSYLASNSTASATMDPKLIEVTSGVEADTVASFTSEGPSINNAAIKPELAAVGTDLYTATQAYDPNGDLYDPSGYTAAQGTSFAVPMVAGAVAMVKQKNPGLITPAQLKSAVVDTANPQVTDFDANGNPVPARFDAAGGGLLDAAAAVETTITAVPATVSFGVVGQGSAPSVGVNLTNIGSATANLSLSTQQYDADSLAQVTLSATSVTLAAGQTSQVTVGLSGSVPNAGSYEGVILVKGGAVDLRIPYQYRLGDGVPANILPLEGMDFVVVPNYPFLRLTLKVVDQSGVPAPNVPVQFAPASAVAEATPVTDGLGIASAVVNAGSQIGEQSFTAALAGVTVSFDGRVRAIPMISANGVVNASSNAIGPGVSPGSYISIYGADLSEATRVFSTSYLPVSLAGVSVSFDAPQAGLSLPGHLHFVSPGQINVQVPWELQGLASVQMKVSIGDNQSALYTVPLTAYSPGFWEGPDVSGTGQLLARAEDEQYNIISTGNPVGRGHIIQFFCNGLGPVTNQPQSGEGSPAASLAETQVKPTVTIGGQDADVQFSGLTPFSVGLYQVNVVVPASIGPGLQPAVISIGGVSSKPTMIPVQ